MSQQRQHIVPQSRLRRFTDDLGIYQFDKVTGKTVGPTSTKVIAGPKGNYTFNISKLSTEEKKGFHRFRTDNEDECSLEPLLEYIDGKEPKAINPIVQKSSILDLCIADKRCLSMAFAVQFIRTGYYKQMVKEVTEKILKITMNADDLKIAFARQVLYGIHELSYPFMNRSWVLFKTEDLLFYISDNPIVLQNKTNLKDLGLMSPAVEIYCPISKTLMLGMFGQSCKKETVLLSKDDVIYYNSLQVKNSLRFIYSSTRDFALAEKMIKNNPKIKEGIGSLIHVG